MKLTDLLVGAAVGAGLMYLLDPHAGTSRRDLREQVNKVTGQAEHRLEDVSQEAHSLFHQAAAQMIAPRSMADCALCERIIAAIERHVPYAQSIHVDVVDGRATLRGPILSHDLLSVLTAARAVPGINSVDSQLDIHQTPLTPAEFAARSAVKPAAP